jgi:hypothetical protein
MLPEVRDAVMRLARRRLLVLDDKAKHTPRWMRFSVVREPEPQVPPEPVA